VLLIGCLQGVAIGVRSYKVMRKNRVAAAAAGEAVAAAIAAAAGAAADVRPAVFIIHRFCSSGADGVVQLWVLAHTHKHRVDSSA
jgi:hypothetical protein